MPWVLNDIDFFLSFNEVQVRFVDFEGRISIIYSDRIILDTHAPTDGTLTATAGHAQVSLSWSDFSDAKSGIKNYKLVFSTGTYPSSCAAGIEIYSGTGTSFIHTGRTNGIPYYYRLCAIDNAENISAGATASATPNPMDSDGDGYKNDVDCNDNDNTIYPGAIEICDNKDNDCDGQTDEGLSTDADSDGHYALGSCLAPADDCDDSNGSFWDGNTCVSESPVTVPDNDSNVTVTFPNVQSGGRTTIDRVECSGVPQGIYIPDTNPVCVQIETTATWSGYVEVCIPYDDTDCANQNPGNPEGQEDCERQLHIIRCDETNLCEQLETNSHDVANNIICAYTDHFSLFIVGRLSGWMGDINKDGQVDISDVILELRIALCLDYCNEAPPACSDINADGQVDISDVILTLRFALELDGKRACT
jgi:hypothetical protein